MEFRTRSHISSYQKRNQTLANCQSVNRTLKFHNIINCYDVKYRYPRISNDCFIWYKQLDLILQLEQFAYLQDWLAINVVINNEFKALASPFVCQYLFYTQDWKALCWAASVEKENKLRLYKPVYKSSISRFRKSDKSIEHVAPFWEFSVSRFVHESFMRTTNFRSLCIQSGDLEFFGTMFLERGSLIQPFKKRKWVL